MGTPVSLSYFFGKEETHMAEKRTTLGQLEDLAIRTKADSAARVNELTKLVIAGLEDVQHVGFTLTLPAANWSGMAQTAKHASFLADENFRYLVSGDADCFGDYSKAVVKADNVTVNGQMTFRCETVPTRNLTVNIIRLEIGGQ